MCIERGESGRAVSRQDMAALTTASLFQNALPDNFPLGQLFPFHSPWASSSLTLISALWPDYPLYNHIRNHPGCLPRPTLTLSLHTMRPQGLLGSLPAVLLLSSPFVGAVSLDCKNVVVDGQHFDLGDLAGPRAVHLIQDTPPSLSNTTFTVDICNPLKRTKGVPKDNECPTGTYGKYNHFCIHQPPD